MIYKNTNTKKRIGAFLFLIFIFTIFLTGCNKTEPPKLVLSEDNWYYGKVTPDQRPSHDFTIKSNDPENPEKTIKTTITVQRVPNPDIELSKQKFDLGNLSREEKASIDFTIFNSGDADLIIKEIISEELFNHNIEIPLTIAPGEQFQVELSVDSSQLKEGEFRKAVRIMTNDPQNPGLFLRIQGKVD